MKKKLITLLAVCALVMSLGMLAACNTTTGTGTGNTAAQLDGLPANLPDSDHINRLALQTQTGTECYTCHGASDDSGTPIDSTARIVPKDHYVDGSYASKKFDPQRLQCNSCHGGPVPGT